MPSAWAAGVLVLWGSRVHAQQRIDSGGTDAGGGEPAQAEPRTPEERAPTQRKPEPGRPAPRTTRHPPVKFPDPLITEVLYAVPGGAEGDANGDGLRSATGDEFVELINPHDKPIQLRGYTLTDGVSPKGGGESQIRFTFPPITLRPGQCVVVFNGYTGQDSEKIGDKRKDAVRGDEGVPPPVVLNMHAGSAYIAFSNTADLVLLTDPKGRAVQSVEWGDDAAGAKLPEKTPPLRERAPSGRGSVTRIGVSKGLIAHEDLPRGEHAPKELYSPGRHSLDAPAGDEHEEPEVVEPREVEKKPDEPINRE